MRPLLAQQGACRASPNSPARGSRQRPRPHAREGLILQLSRGLYQLPGADDDANHAIAQAAKLVPKGVVCLVSALAFHQLTDTIPRSVWMAIGPKDRQHIVARPPLQIVRFRDNMLHEGIEEHCIGGVTVPMFNVSKTAVDLFRHRQSASKLQNSPGLDLALEGLREALRQNKRTSAEIAEYGGDARIWKVAEPYVQVMM